MDTDKMIEAFEASMADPEILTVRLAVLETGGSILRRMGRLARVHGVIARNQRTFAFAILAKLAADLAMGFASLVKTQNTYAAAALLRQIVELEYIFLSRIKIMMSLRNGSKPAMMT